MLVMLVLSRKVRQRIHIGDNIVITVVQIKGKGVRLGIDAPKDLRVLRSELLPRSVNESNEDQQPGEED